MSTTSHEVYAAITKPGRFEQGMKGSWRGSVRCVFDGEVARCNHRHQTESVVCPELDA